MGPAKLVSILWAIFEISPQLKDLINICCDHDHEKRASLNKIKNHVFIKNYTHNITMYEQQPSTKSIKRRNRKRTFGEMDENGDGLT